MSIFGVYIFALVKFLKSHHGAEGVDPFSGTLESDEGQWEGSQLHDESLCGRQWQGHTHSTPATPQDLAGSWGHREE